MIYKSLTYSLKLGVLEILRRLLPSLRDAEVRSVKVWPRGLAVEKMSLLWSSWFCLSLISFLFIFSSRTILFLWVLSIKESMASFSMMMTENHRDILWNENISHSNWIWNHGEIHTSPTSTSTTDQNIWICLLAPKNRYRWRLSHVTIELTVKR